MSLPIVLAAKIFKRKIILLEPNSIIGRSNKFLLKFSSYIMCYDKDIQKNSIIPNYKKVNIDPILNNCFYFKQNSIEKKDEIFKILIIGGSQSSLFFSKNLKSEIIQLSKKYKVAVSYKHLMLPTILLV